MIGLGLSSGGLNGSCGTARRAPSKSRIAGVVAVFNPSKPEVLSHTSHPTGVSVFVGRGFGVYRVRVTADQPRPSLVMHWAVNDWQQPPEEVLLPPGSVPAGGTGAVQTPFQDGEISITFPESVCPSKLVFVLKDGEVWRGSGDDPDFTALLKPEARAGAAGLAGVVPVQAAETQLLLAQHFPAGLWVFVGKKGGSYQVKIEADQPRLGLVLHWAVDNWEMPPREFLPRSSVPAADGCAIQTPFVWGESVSLTFPQWECPSRLVFVLKDGDNWINNGGTDFSIQLPHIHQAPLAGPTQDGEMMVAVVSGRKE